MKAFLKPTFASLLTLALIGATANTQAQEKPKQAEAAKTVKAAKPAEHTEAGTTPATPAAPALQNRAKPYGGTISAVDKTAKTITVKKKEAEKTFSITSATKIMKAGKPATLEDAVVGEEAGISYTDAEGGKAEARSIRLGAKPEKAEAVEKKADKAEKKPKKEKKEKPADEAKPADKQ